MNKKLIKILTLIVYILCITNIFSMALAAITDDFQGDIAAGGTDTTPIKDIVSAVLSVIRTVGAFIAVGILIVISMKYMIASAGDRADIKKYAVTYIIGAIILFGTSGIASLLKAIIDGAFGGASGGSET